MMFSFILLRSKGAVTLAEKVINSALIILCKTTSLK